VTPPSEEGFGSRLMQRTWAAELDAEVTMDYRPEGFVFTARAPWGARKAAPPDRRGETA